MLIASTVFLLNLVLLLVYNIGTSLPAVMGGDDVGAVVIVSILAYVGIFLTTVVLVNLHIVVESAGPYEGGTLSYGGAAVDWSTSHVLPVPLLQDGAVPVPLDFT